MRQITGRHISGFTLVWFTILSWNLNACESSGDVSKSDITNVPFHVNGSTFANKQFEIHRANQLPVGEVSLQKKQPASLSRCLTLAGVTDEWAKGKVRLIDNLNSGQVTTIVNSEANTNQIAPEIVKVSTDGQAVKK